MQHKEETGSSDKKQQKLCGVPYQIELFKAFLGLLQLNPEKLHRFVQRGLLSRSNQKRTTGREIEHNPTSED